MRELHKPKSSVLHFVAISLAAHVQAVLIVVVVLAANPEGCTIGQPMKLEPFEVSVVPVEDPLTAEKKKDEEIRKEDEKEKKKDAEAKGQVVDLPKPADERRPDKARFLSEYDSTVRKETRAAPTPSRAGALRRHQPVPPQKASPAMRRRIARKVLKLAMRAQRPQPEEPTSAAKASKDGELAVPKKKKPKQPAIKVVGKKPQKPRKGKDGKSGAKKMALKDLRLSPQELAKLFGGRASDSLPEDVKDGKHTLLNSKRWRHASFFNRVKRQVAQNWHPNRVYRRRDPSGNIYGFKDRLTVLRVKLTPKGELKAVHLEKASGVGFLDDEAVRAFRLAQPFPNPPSALVDDNTGIISFRFGFMFEISRRPNFKVFRYR